MPFTHNLFSAPNHKQSSSHRKLKPFSGSGMPRTALNLVPVAVAQSPSPMTGDQKAKSHDRYFMV